MNLSSFTSLGLPVALATIMFSMGLSLCFRHFIPVFQQPRAVLVGISAQMLCVPLLAVLVVLLTGLTGALAVGLMILSFSPGGTTSNLFSQLAKGDVPLSICLTTLAGLLTPVTLPLFAAWALQWQGQDAANVDFPIAVTIVRLVAVMLLPLVLGMLLNRLFPQLAQRIARVVKPLGVAIFATVIASMVIQRWPVLAAWIAQLGVPVLLLIVLALSMGWALARGAGLAAAQRKTISIEVGMQNGGAALLLTEGVLHNAQMSSVPLLYGLLMLIPVLMMVWSGRRERS